MPFVIPNQNPPQKQYQSAAPQMPKPGLSIPKKPNVWAGPMDLGAPRQIGPPQQPSFSPANLPGAQGGVYSQPGFQQPLEVGTKGPFPAGPGFAGSYPMEAQPAPGPNFSGNYIGNPNAIAANTAAEPQPLPKPVGEPIVDGFQGAPQFGTSAEIDPVALREERRQRLQQRLNPAGPRSSGGPMGLGRRPIGRGYRPY